MNPRAARPSALPAETIVAVAHCWRGLIFSLPAPARHHDVIHLMAWLGIDHEARLPDAQGFLTNHGRWVGRTVALEIAHRAGQIIEKHGAPDELFSEDLW